MTRADRSDSGVRRRGSAGRRRRCGVGAARPSAGTPTSRTTAGERQHRAEHRQRDDDHADQRVPAAGSPARKPASCRALGGATYFSGVEAVDRDRGHRGLVGEVAALRRRATASSACRGGDLVLVADQVADVAWPGAGTAAAGPGCSAGSAPRSVDVDDLGGDVLRRWRRRLQGPEPLQGVPGPCRTGRRHPQLSVELRSRLPSRRVGAVARCRPCRRRRASRSSISPRARSRSLLVREICPVRITARVCDARSGSRRRCPRCAGRTDFSAVAGAGAVGGRSRPRRGARRRRAAAAAAGERDAGPPLRRRAQGCAVLGALHGGPDRSRRRGAWLTGCDAPHPDPVPSGWPQ